MVQPVLTVKEKKVYMGPMESVIPALQEQLKPVPRAIVLVVLLEFTAVPQIPIITTINRLNAYPQDAVPCGDALVIIILVARGLMLMGYVFLPGCGQAIFIRDGPAPVDNAHKTSYNPHHQYLTPRRDIFRILKCYTI
jgi:hypothetical protein